MESNRNKKIGEMFLEKGKIREAQLEDALKRQKEAEAKGEKKRIGSILVELGWIEEIDLAWALAAQFKLPYANLEKQLFAHDVVSLIPEEFARRHEVIAISKQGNIINIAMADPLDIAAVDDLRVSTGCKIQAAVCTPSDMKIALAKYYGKDAELSP